MVTVILNMDPKHTRSFYGNKIITSMSKACLCEIIFLKNFVTPEKFSGIGVPTIANL